MYRWKIVIPTFSVVGMEEGSHVRVLHDAYLQARRRVACLYDHVLRH